MRSLLLLLLLCCSPLYAESGYRYVHPDGTVEFSDQPIPEAEEIKLRPVPTIKLTPVPPSSVQSAGRVGGETGSATITITSPQAGETLSFAESGVTVTVTVTPPLQGGQQITITLDGKVVSRGIGHTFNLGMVYRGSHILEAQIVSETGTTLSSSPPLSFYVRQHTVIKREPPPPEE